MDDMMLANAAKRRLETKPLLTITIAAGPGPEKGMGKPHPKGCQCEECMGEEGEEEYEED